MLIKTDKVELEILPGESFFVGIKNHHGLDKFSISLKWDEMAPEYQIIFMKLHQYAAGYVDTILKVKSGSELKEAYADTLELYKPFLNIVKAK
jgi:hypothetical protein